MIIYDTRKFFGYGVLLHLRSTVLLEQIPFGLFAAGLSLALTMTGVTEPRIPSRGELMPEVVVGHPAAAQYTFAVVLSFLLVFRTNQAYNRWWEGRTALTSYSSRLGCVGLQFMSMTHRQDTRNELLRLLLLVNAVVFENLRGDTAEDLEVTEMKGSVIRGSDSSSKGCNRFALKDESGVIKLSESEIRMLDQSNSLDREFICMAWLHSMIGCESEKGHFYIAAPILSRGYQV